MSYTRPDFDSADASFEGADIYIRPDFNSADAQFDIESEGIFGFGNLVAIAQSVELIASGNINQITQEIAIIASGNLSEIEQAINLRQAASGVLISIAQTVNATASGNLTRIAQRVRDTAVAQPRFSLDLIIDGQRIPENRIHGEIIITRSESSAALMDVTLIPPSGAQDVTWYQGKSITLDYLDQSGAQRVYTGKVDIPEVDLIAGKIKLRCTDNRTEQNNALPPSFVRGIGHYSSAVFREAKDLSDELENRIQTVQASVDYDANGLVTLTPWAPKAEPDFVFDDPSIYRRTPSVEYNSRGRVVNRVKLNLTYRYQRLRRRSVNFFWDFWPVEQTGSLDFPSTCLFILNNTGMARVTQVKQSAEATGWDVDEESWEFEPLWKDGWYRCGGQLIGWTTRNFRTSTEVKRDAEGEPVKDAQGNTVYTESLSGYTDYRDTFTLRAQWSMANQWAQTIEQRSAITISNPLSIAQYGAVEREENYGTEYKFATEDWERRTGGMSATDAPFVSPNGDLVIDVRMGGLSEFSEAARCAIAKAQTVIAASHRANYVRLQIPFKPEIDLRHTVQTTAGRIQTKGKVYSIRHWIDVGNKWSETEVTLAVSKVRGGSESVNPAPVPIPLPTITDQANSAIKNVRLGNWIGGETRIPLPDNANGLITNYTSPLRRTGILYPEAFIVDTPPVEESARDTRTEEAASTYSYPLRDDPLEVVFND